MEIGPTWVTVPTGTWMRRDIADHLAKKAFFVDNQIVAAVKVAATYQMTTTHSTDMPETLRYIPTDWLYPVTLSQVFSRPGPVHIDLGCGKGRFLLARAAAHREVNFLGIDRMLRRIRKIDSKARRRGLDNIRLMRIEGYYAVSYLIPPTSIDTYFILFPDPWPKKKHHDHRLFNPRFVDALHRTMKPGGVVHLATDHLPYFDEIAAIMRADVRFTETEPFVPEPEERTDFELWYLDKKPIGRCSFIRTP